MSYLSNAIGKITRRNKRTHAQPRPLAAVAARRHAFIESAVEALEGRQLLSAAAVHIANTSVTEGGDLVYNVMLNQPTNKAVSVNFALVGGGTAEERVNYKPLKASTVTIPAGQTSASVSVKTRHDHVYADDKTLLAQISKPTNGASLRKSKAKGKIVNTDPPPTIVVKNAKTTEGQQGNKVLTFVVKMTGTTPSTPVRINYATQNVTARSKGKKADFNAAKGTLTFDAAHKRQTINVVIRGDKVAEADEAFRLNFTPAKGSQATILNRLVPNANFAVGSIINDDKGNVSPGTTVSTFPAAVNVNPGSTAGVNIVLNQISADPLTVFYSTSDGTAAAGADYTAASGSVTFNPGETSKTVTVATAPGSAGGTFNVTVANPNAGATIATGTSTVNITNAALPSLSVSTISVAEGNSGTTSAVFTVALTAPATQPITVGYATADGSATAGSDYTATSGTLSFAPGETSKTVTVAVLGDTKAEGNETFSLVLGAPVNAPISVGTGICTILDDDGGAIDNTGLTFTSQSGFGFNTSLGTTRNEQANFHYEVQSTRSTGISNAQLQFFLVPMGTNLDTATPYRTEAIGSIAAGQTVSGTVDARGTHVPQDGDKYYARLVVNGVVFDTVIGPGFGTAGF